MGAAPNPRALTRRSGASSHVLRFPLRAFLRFPGCPPAPSPSSAFLRFPFVRRSPVRSLRPLPGSGSPSVSLRVPFPLSNLHVSAAAGRFRRRRSQAAGTKVTSSAATASPGSRDPPALQMGSAWARWDAATESPVTSGRRAQDIAEHRTSPRPNRADQRRCARCRCQGRITDCDGLVAAGSPDIRDRERRTGTCECRARSSGYAPRRWRHGAMARETEGRATGVFALPAPARPGVTLARPNQIPNGEREERCG